MLFGQHKLYFVKKWHSWQKNLCCNLRYKKIEVILPLKKNNQLGDYNVSFLENKNPGFRLY